MPTISRTQVSKIVTETLDSRIRYQRNAKNLGMAGNWNQESDQGINYLDVTPFHADNQLLRVYVGQMRRALTKLPEVAAFFCLAEIIDSNGKHAFSFGECYKSRLIPKGSMVNLKGPKAIQNLMRGNFVFCPTLCFNLRVLKELRFDPEYKMVLHYDLVLRLLRDGEQLAGLYRTPLYQYRRQPLNATTMMNQNQIRFREEAAIIARYDRENKSQIVALNLTYLSVMAFIRLNFKEFLNFAKQLKTHLTTGKHFD